MRNLTKKDNDKYVLKMCSHCSYVDCTDCKFIEDAINKLGKLEHDAENSNEENNGI